jgi:hypothetical protein
MLDVRRIRHLTLKAVRRGSPQGSSNCAAEIPAQGSEQLITRFDFYYWTAIPPQAYSGAIPPPADTPCCRLLRQLLQVRYVPAFQLFKSLHPGLENFVFPPRPHDYVKVIA